MFYPDSRVRAYVYTEAVDMRKSFKGLSGVVRSELNGDPLSGHVFCFFNRRRNFVKLLFWERTGYCIIAKRLVRGTFSALDAKEITMRDLKAVLEGIEYQSLRWRKSYEYIPQ